MEVVLGIGSLLLIVVLGIFGIHSLYQAVNLLIKVKKQKLDERYEFMVFKALGYTMIIILILHLVQLIVGGIVGIECIKNGKHFIPIVSAGMPYRTIIGNSPLHIEAIVFDGTVFGLIFKRMKKQYGE